MLYRLKILRILVGLVLIQSHYVEKIIEKFNNDDFDISRTLIYTCQHLSKNKGKIASQVEHSKIIWNEMYLISYTKPERAYEVSNITKVLKRYS